MFRGKNSRTGFWNHVSWKTHLLANGIGDFCYGLSTRKPTLSKWRTANKNSFIFSPKPRDEEKSGKVEMLPMQRKYLASIHPSHQPVSTILSPKCWLTVLSIISVLQTTWDLNYSTTKKNRSTKKTFTFPTSQKLNQPNQPNHFPRRKFPAP